jgi:CheY-like chemotaxis protein
MGQALSMSAVESEGDAEAPDRPIRPRVIEFAWSLDVMVVEDDAADTSLMLDVLRRNMGVRQVWSFEDPEAALLSLTHKRVQPDLILLDIRMPKLSGFGFIEKLREIPAFYDTQVVLITTSRLARDVERASRSAVSGYVVKPDTYDELRKRIDCTVSKALKRAWG